MDQRAIDDLARSGITPEEAERADIFDVPDAFEVCPDFAHLPALVIPYLAADRTPVTYMRDGVETPFCRVRYLELAKQKATIRRKAQRYAQPHKSGCQIYLPPVLDWEAIMADSSQPLVITEGEKKALCGCLSGLNVIGLGGVHNFMSAGFLHPVLRKFEYGPKRRVSIVFDSDAATNPHIALAEERLLNIFGARLGATANVVRLPQPGAAKVGLDDYIVEQGAERARLLVGQMPALTALDRDVLALNEHVAWVQREGRVYEFRTGHWLKRVDFVEAPPYSKWNTTVPDAKTGLPKKIKTAKAWLSHPKARVFDDVLFRPGDGICVPIPEGDGVALNNWRGWNAEKGDVAPFYELSEFLFQELPVEIRDLPVKYMAWKAQNPQVKRALAVMLVGPPGCGKSLWSRSLREAFDPYTKALKGGTFVKQNFWGWLEKTVLATLDELGIGDMEKNRDVLWNLISEERQALNEKFLIERDISNFTAYILTTNFWECASLAEDDRRILVVGCPSHVKNRTEQEAEAFFNRIGAWLDAGGGKALMWHLLNLDLQGWTPPQRAPTTQVKRMAAEEGLSPIQRIASKMHSADENLVKVWLDQAYSWAQRHKSDPGMDGSVAEGFMLMLPTLSVRPFYTADELANLLPPVVGMLGSDSYKAMHFTPAAISRALRNSGIPILPSAESVDGFKWKGIMRQFLIISSIEDWKQPLSQSEFERVMTGFPKYSDLLKERRK